MSFKSKVKVVTGFIMRSLTRHIGVSGSHTAPADPLAVKRVLICRPNHRLGNLLLITPLIQEVSLLFPQARIDLFVKGNLGVILFQEYDAVDRIIQLPRKPLKGLRSYIAGWLKIMQRRYDIAINVVHASSSGRLSTKFSNAKYKYFGDIPEAVKRKYTDHEHIAKYPVYSFRENLRPAIAIPPLPVAPLRIKLSTAELAEGKRLLRNIIPHTGRTICLFTFATGTKCYDTDFWQDFYNRLRMAYPQYAIFEMLPVENVSQLSFSIPHFYSKDIRQIAAVLANTSIFIGADSGMMHLASAAGVPTAGLFKVTDMKSYEPYGRGSTGIHTVNQSPTDWMRAIAQVLNNNTLAENFTL